MTNHEIGEIHWSDLNDSKYKVAMKWIESFFNSPMTFFMMYSQKKYTKTRKEIIETVIPLLETNNKIPEGFSRLNTTLHLDYENSDVREIWMLERIFRMLRAYPWDSRGSPLIQLCDILLNVASNVESGVTSFDPTSYKGKLKQSILDKSKEKYNDVRDYKNNFLIMRENGDIKLVYELNN
ncbi:hypothetical protein AB3N59_15035 [Leptospira sp. WS92.C1]